MNYIAQCGHEVNKKDLICPICNKLVERIWDVDVLGVENVTKLQKAWDKNIKPKAFYKKEILPYNRDEYIFRMCSIWDDENPNADDETRDKAFYNIISDAYRKEYYASRDNYNYYLAIKTINAKDKDYIVV